MQPNRKTLCTRALDPQLISKAAVHLVTIDVLPFIEIKKIDSPEFNQQVELLAQQKLQVIFTSNNAVESVAAFLPEKHNWKIHCLGGATKDAVVKHFGKDIIVTTAKSASLLAKKIVEQGDIKEVTFFCGDQRLDDLPETLGSNNITVHEVIAYNTLQTPHEVQEDYDGILFFSPTAVHSFFSINTIRTDVVLFSIGRTTSATIQSYCNNKVVTSEWPGQENLVDKVLGYEWDRHEV